MHIQPSLSLHFSYFILLLNNFDGNDAFWRHSMLAKQFSLFSRKHRILSLQICVCQTVRLTWKPKQMPMFMVLSSQQSHCERSLSSFDVTVERHQTAANPQTKPNDLDCSCQSLHPPSPFIIVG